MGIQSLLDTQVLSITGSTGDVMTLQADGTYLPETPSGGGTPGGSSGQMQYNNAGAFGGTVAVVYAGSGSHLSVTAQAATDVPVTVKGAVSQTANLTEWKNSAGTKMASISPSGLMYLSDGSNVNRYIQLYQSGSSCILNMMTQNGSAYIRYGGSDRIRISSVGITVSNANLIVDADTSAITGVGNNAPGTWESPSGSDVRIVGGSPPVGNGGGVVQLRSGPAAGTDQAGSSTIIGGGPGTGTGTPGSVDFMISVPSLTTGSSAHSTWENSVSIDSNATAGETRMLLYDVDAGSLVRVSVGAADSGGTGYKILRVPN